MADKRVKYIADDGPFCEVGITGKQTSWRLNQSGFVTEANAALLIASGKFVLSSTAFATDADGLDSHLSEHAAIGSPIIKKFPTWPTNTGFLLASLVASSTASRTSGVVTIAATAHGITTGTTYVGFRFYYPGSTSLTAGWYDSILTIPDANTITFSAAGTDFGSESINGGSAWTTITDLTSMTIPGNTLKDQSRLALCVLRSGDSVASNKSIYLAFGGSSAAFSAVSVAPSCESRLSFRCFGTNKQFGSQSMDGSVNSSAFMSTTKDITVDQTLTVRGALTVASQFLSIFGCHVEITV